MKTGTSFNKEGGTFRRTGGRGGGRRGGRIGRRRWEVRRGGKRKEILRS